MTPAQFGIIIALLATTLLGATGAVIYQLSQRTNQPPREAASVAPTQTPFPSISSGDVSVPADWKTYTSNDYSFKYPPSLHIVIPKLEGEIKVKYVVLTNLNVRENGVPEDSILYEEERGGIGGTGFAIYDGFWLRVEESPTDQPQDVIDNVRSANKTSARLTVDRQEAYKRQQENRGGGYTGTQIWIDVIKDSRLYGIETDLRSDVENYSDLFDKILSTFRFSTSDSEKLLIDSWLQENNLNQYGDRKDTAYTGGTPLFDERTGERTDRYDYLIKKFPGRPWGQ